ncbi:MAG: hypothetical protein Q4G69_04515, partial [Planctomycetia bacterium]|nr:hypothetical protein [Planctomycetia bacterium]
QNIFKKFSVHPTAELGLAGSTSASLQIAWGKNSSAIKYVAQNCMINIAARIFHNKRFIIYNLFHLLLV